MLFDRSVYDRLVQESADAAQYAKSISGVAPVAFSEPETELRLRAYAPRQTHDSGVHDRVRAFVLRATAPDAVKNESTTVYMYDDNLRRIVDDKTQDEVYQRKTTLYTNDNAPFAIRCVVSREDTLTAGFKMTSRPFMVRKRERMRISYMGVFIDLTTVTGAPQADCGDRGGRSGRSGGRNLAGRGRAGRVQSARGEPTVRYEVEIEIPNISTFAYPTLAKIVRNLFRVVRATEVPYPVSLYAMMAEFHNTTLAQEATLGKSMFVDDFDTRVQSRARPLKLLDLVYGGIVGPVTHYSVTPKADGVRTAFMVHNTGVWLYSGNGLLNCLALSRDFDDMHGTILDMESIPMQNRTAREAKQFQYFLVAFDTLSISSSFARGSTTVQSEDHDIRMVIAERVLGSITERLGRTNPALALLRTKTFYYALTVEQYFDAVHKARHLLDSGVLPYTTDGLVFTPSNLKSIPYPGIHNIHLSKRILSDYPDIVKYKPVEKLTVDFSVNVADRLLMSSGPGNTLVPFSARNFNMIANVAWEDCARQRIPRDAIVEFEWRDSQFHPIRPRNDRDQPNRLDIAVDNFKHIREAISYDTIEGLTPVLRFRYHNQVKKLLYTTAATARARLDAGDRRGGYSLLDLGSGNGADLTKWAEAGFTHVIAVEPSEQNSAEFKRRLKSLMEEGRAAQSFPQIEIVDARAEDTDKILTCSMKQLGEEPKVDVISSMLSASFFWKDDATLASVVATIKRHSKKGTLFLMFTINGGLIEELISPSMREGVVLESPITLGDFTLDIPLGEWAQITGRPIGGVDGLLPHATGRSYTVTIKGSKIVHEMDGVTDTAQREYMVYIPQLTSALQPEFRQVLHEVANKQPLLQGASRMVSSLYSYCIYERVQE